MKNGNESRSVYVRFENRSTACLNHLPCLVAVSALLVLSACGNGQLDDPRAPDPSLSVVTASPDTVPADGVSTSTITVEVKDQYGSPFRAVDIYIGVLGEDGILQLAGGEFTISQETITPDARGVVTAKIASTEVGILIIAVEGEYDAFDGQPFSGGSDRTRIRLNQTLPIEFVNP